MEVAIVMVAVIGYLAFRQWLQFNRRTMIHRERLAAIEKGVDLPPVEQEVRRSSWVSSGFYCWRAWSGCRWGLEPL
jgi:hypothetical protein